MNPSSNNAFDSFDNGRNIAAGASSNQNRSKWVKLAIAVGVAILVCIVIFIVWQFASSNPETKEENAVNTYINLLARRVEEDESFSGPLSLGVLKNSSESEKNIYNVFLVSTSIDEKVSNYYQEIVSTLKKINEIALNNDFDDVAFWSKISTEIMPRYFVSSILVLTNADYEYFMQNRNIDGLLEKYDYPFEETDEVFLQSYDDLINDYYEQKIVLYSEINKTNCVMNDGIDYKCLSSLNNETIKATQFTIEDMYIGMKEISNSMLNIIISNANSMYDYFIGGQND